MSRQVILCVVFFLMSICTPARAQDEAAERPIFALIVGSNAYIPPPTTAKSGTGETPTTLPDLQHADDDALRYVWLLKTLPNVRQTFVLTEPDAATQADLKRLGITEVLPPTVNALNSALEMLKSLMAKEQNAQLMVFLSAHGDDRGFHLRGGVYPGADLRQKLDALGKVDVLLVADTCYSNAWLFARGILSKKDGAPLPEGVLPDPAAPVGRASESVSPSSGSPRDAKSSSKPVANVGAVTTTSVTPEDRSSLHGGVLTHVVTSGLLGDADLNQDGVITYQELKGYLEQYLPLHGDRSNVTGIHVEPPSNGGQEEPALIRVRGPGRVRLVFPARAESLFGWGTFGQECFWIRDTNASQSSPVRWIAELCKPLVSLGQLYVPPGKYQIYRMSPPEQGWGEKGEVPVEGTEVTVSGTDLVRRWRRIQITKGNPKDIPADAEPLSEADDQYLERTAYYTEVKPARWPGYRSRALRLEYFVPVLTEDSMEEAIDSISQEKPAEWLAGLQDLRLRQWQRGRLIVGVDAALGLSTGNRVNGVDEVAVLMSRVRLRTGAELALSRLTLRGTACAGVLSALPQDPADYDPSLQERPSSNFVAFAPTGALELAADLRVMGGLRLEPGLAFHRTWEPYLDSNEVVAASQHDGLSFWLAVRW